MGLFGRKKTTMDAAPPAGPHHRTDLVVPLLAGTAWMAANTERFAQIPGFPESAHPHARPLAEGLWATYASDAEGIWDLVQRGQVDELGGEEALHALARENLRRRVGGGIRLDGGEGRYGLEVPSESDLTASLLLIPEVWRSAVAIEGQLAVAVPTRVELFLCSAADAETVASLQEMTPALFDGARGKPVSPALFTLDGGTLQPIG
ncbi:DUF1444 domain-containing protein [Microbacterium tumbae]